MHHSEMQHSSGAEALGQSAGRLTQHPTLSLDATHLLQESSTQTQCWDQPVLRFTASE